MRSRRAEQIASALSNNELWHSHARGISMETLRSELNLQIDDLNDQPCLAKLVRRYHELSSDFLSLHQGRFVYWLHTPYYF